VSSRSIVVKVYFKLVISSLTINSHTKHIKTALQLTSTHNIFTKLSTWEQYTN
jgi:hypothetical protein